VEIASAEGGGSTVVASGSVRLRRVRAFSPFRNDETNKRVSPVLSYDTRTSGYVSSDIL